MAALVAVVAVRLLELPRLGLLLVLEGPRLRLLQGRLRLVPRMGLLSTACGALSPERLLLPGLLVAANRFSSASFQPSR